MSQRYGGGVDVEATAARIAEALRAAGSAERAEHDTAYLRSDLEHWGVPVPEARRAIRLAEGRPTSDEVRGLATALWSSGVFDQRLAAALVLDRHAAAVRAADLPWLEGLLREARTWALVDVLVPRPLAATDASDPAATSAVLDQWARDGDFWLRRSALLAHLIGLRGGGGNWQRFAGYADTMLQDGEFFVQKAMGWVLRETARQDPERVRDWVAPRTDRIRRVTLREALKPLPPEDRDRLLQAFLEGRPA